MAFEFPAEKRRTYAPPPMREQDEWEMRLDLPKNHATFDWLRRKAEQEGVTLAHAHEAADRPMERPLVAQVAIMPRDERRAKYGKPVAFLDMGAPGQTPMMIMGGETMHLMDLKDIADSRRSYQQDELVEQPTDWNAVLHELRERKKARRVGRHVFGPSPTTR